MFSIKSRNFISIFLIAGLLVGALLPEADAQQKRKKKDNGAAAAQAKLDAEIQEKLKKVDGDISALLKKSPSRSLFSPNEVGKLTEIKYTLLDMVDQYPTNPGLAKPLYRIGMLYADRQEFSNSYELFRIILEQFPTSPYGPKTNVKLDQLRAEYGEKYFPALPKPETVVPEAEITTPNAGKTN